MISSASSRSQEINYLLRLKNDKKLHLNFLFFTYLYSKSKVNVQNKNPILYFLINNYM